MKNMKNKLTKDDFDDFMEIIKSWQTDHEEYRDLIIDKIDFYENTICAEAHDEDTEYVLHQIDGNIRVSYVSHN